MKRSRIISMCAAALIGLGVYAWIAVGPPASATQGAVAEDAGENTVQAVRVVAMTSVAQPLNERLVLRGVTEAARNVDVKAQIGGLVVSEPLRKGAHVAEGALLCQLETADRAARVTEAEARLAQAIADSEASAALNERGFRAATQLAADAASLEAARAAVTLAQLDLARTELRAPFHGLLESDSAEIGALLQPGDVCATVIELNPIKVVGFAPERAIGGVEIGRTVRAELASGETLEAVVSFVARSADTETRTFRVEATAANASEAIRDGVTAEIEIALNAAPAHLLPHSALTLSNTGDLGVRLVTESGDGPVAGFAPVVVLRDTVDGLWVSGLDARADVIVVGQEFVTTGAPIIPSFTELEPAATDQ